MTRGVAMEPWLDQLGKGRTQAAWDLFVDQYRALMLATIRRLVANPDDAMDVFAIVCQVLTADDFARLRRYSSQAARAPMAAGWVVAVVRNLTIDWMRHEYGRPRLVVPASLSPIRREIYRALCLEGAGHREAFERLAVRTDASLTFSAFMREVRETNRLAPCPPEHGRRPRDVPLARDAETPAPDPLAVEERRDLGVRLDLALATLPDDVRVALMLFVVDGLAAEEVARVVGWPNAKAVYNRLYRAFGGLREALAREGIRPGDL